MRSDGMDCLNAMPSSISGGSKIASTLSPSIAIGPVGLDRVGDEVRRELDHPGARVLVPLLVEADGDPLHRLE